MTKKSYKVRYIVFVLTVIVTIIANEAILRYNLSLQNSDAKIINVAGRQRMLSQRITKSALFIADTRFADHVAHNKEGLRTLVNEFESANNFLITREKQENSNEKIQVLLDSVQPAITALATSAKEIIRSTDSLAVLNAIRSIADTEPVFLSGMENIVWEYQRTAENKLANTKRTALLLSILSIVVLLGEFIFIIAPFFNQLLKNNKALALANRKLSDFAHITSHNLRAPLSNMNALLHFYKESDDAEDRADLMDKFETVITNMNVTMNVLVEALKASAETVEEHKKLVFEETLNTTKDSVSCQIKESGATIVTDFQEAPSISYNALYLESIFLNMITNAIRYKSEKRAPVLHIKSYREYGKTLLSFKDNGLGINLARHGDKLFGLNKTFHRHPDSKGVGLFMTRTHIESMGGEISAVSTVDVGTTFTIIF